MLRAPTEGLSLFPNDAGPAVDQNNFVSGVFGSFSVLDDGDATAGETKTYTFVMYGDDGMQLRIGGADFHTFINGSCVATGEDIAGDVSLTGNCYTGDNRATGQIDLVEGSSYSFEAYEYEGGGDAGLGLFFAEGAFAGYDNSNFYPLAVAMTIHGLPANSGLALVPEPSTYLLAAIAVVGAIVVRRRRK